ncbi:ATP-binding cassette domain-containing protein [Virgibacillus sp. SK37]|uniref:ABC transporter ATP-binding protein n=1 Tax=Virgibacillus sp. SK37 TaxID=403957 RepID=UPI0004D0C84D|nr:ATP-binding cassette domain-containing protein [Virgibacillus sp. SK37]AIF44318.1 ABC transporter ATP-binding protein [Virgibacillus sp. SK37]
MFEIVDLEVDSIFGIEHVKIDTQVTSIVGQSGSGKSTFLRLLNNLDAPSKGNIYYRDKSLSDTDPIELRQKVVMVPQTPVIFDGTIYDNLVIGHEFSGQKRPAEEDLLKMLEMLQLDKNLHTNASELSGGEKQRLALGRVLLMDSAEVYLLDEPSSALDDKTAEHVLGKVINFSKNHDKQIIMVTHDQDLAKKYADKIIEMDMYSYNVKGGKK